jgi:hypothetical protein
MRFFAAVASSMPTISPASLGFVAVCEDASRSSVFAEGGAIVAASKQVQAALAQREDALAIIGRRRDGLVAMAPSASPGESIPIG